MKTVQDLRSIQSQAILRLNCPGYGQASALSEGAAPPLTEYKVIIVNPLSILHIFAVQAEMTKQIDIAIGEGVTSFKLPDEQLINKIGAEIDSRSQEILQFLGQGGLLVYYLCRPFVLTSSSRILDNYAWLGGLAPDQSGQSTMGEHTKRHMSTVAHGRNIDKTAEVESTEFSKYFDQPGLEWNTIIRAEYLTEGYTALALAGPKKCISGQLMVGDCGGQVVFLPAPYSADFDRTLIDCIYQWHTNNLAKRPSCAAEKVPSDIEVPQENVLQPEVKIAPATKPLAKTVTEPSLKLPLSDIQSVPTETNVQPAPRATKLKQLFAQQSMPPAQNVTASAVKEKQPGTANVNGQDKDEPAENSVPGKVLEELKQSLPVAAMAMPHIETSLPKEHKNLSPTEDSVENWANSYSLLGIDEIIAETQAVHEHIMHLRRQVAAKEEMVGFLETVKAPLLSGQGGSLVESGKTILNALGWASKTWGSNPNEFLLNDNGQPVALTCFSLSKGPVERGELAYLAESMINYWNESKCEVKGVFIACPFADTAIAARKEPAFGEMVNEFAKHKNICLLSTLQLIYIYRDIRLGKADAKSIRQTILACNGCLSGFTA